MELIKVVIVHNGQAIAKIRARTPDEAFDKFSRFFKKKFLNGGV